MARFRIGSAPAVLHWGDRQIPGRVIYEYLFLLHFNRLSRSYFGLWKDFHGLYLRVGEQGDCYFHSQDSELLQPLTGRVSGFLFLKTILPPVFPTSTLALLISNRLSESISGLFPGTEPLIVEKLHTQSSLTCMESIVRGLRLFLGEGCLRVGRLGLSAINSLYPKIKGREGLVDPLYSWTAHPREGGDTAGMGPWILAMETTAIAWVNVGEEVALEDVLAKNMFGI